MKRIITIYVLLLIAVFVFADTKLEQLTKRLDASETFYKSFGNIKSVRHCNLLIDHFITDFDYFMESFQSIMLDEIDRGVRGLDQVDKDIQTQSLRLDDITDFVISKTSLYRGNRELEKKLKELNKIGKSYNPNIEVAPKLSKTGDVEKDLFTAMDKLAALSTDMDKIVTADDCVKVVKNLNSRFLDVAILIMKVGNKYGNLNDVPKEFNDKFLDKSKRMTDMMNKFPDVVVKFKDSDEVLKALQKFQNTANTWDNRLKKFY